MRYYTFILSLLPSVLIFKLIEIISGFFKALLEVLPIILVKNLLSKVFELLITLDKVDQVPFMV